ncbi:unnamed protein product [Rangifer tarandus platyrhynchus]|uniref:Uncharacterized protein n=1 Tax=Rangifer tarandus platyrhynchus TaxID=3082113 RepID=A0ABN8YR70_RANTA|nr:unnamed protein product [Rangifer tarandus platyrhynchus]
MPGLGSPPAHPAPRPPREGSSRPQHPRPAVRRAEHLLLLEQNKRYARRTSKSPREGRFFQSAKQRLQRVSTHPGALGAAQLVEGGQIRESQRSPGGVEVGARARGLGSEFLPKFGPRRGAAPTPAPLGKDTRGPGKQAQSRGKRKEPPGRIAGAGACCPPRALVRPMRSGAWLEGSKCPCEGKAVRRGVSPPEISAAARSRRDLFYPPRCGPHPTPHIPRLICGMIRLFAKTELRLRNC